MSATIYFSVRVRLTEVSTELGFVVKGNIRHLFPNSAWCSLKCNDLNRDRTYLPIHVSVLITSLFGAVLES